MFYKNCSQSSWRSEIFKVTSLSYKYRSKSPKSHNRLNTFGSILNLQGAHYRTRSRCSISVALLVFKLCSIPEQMFLNTCKRSVPSDQLVFFPEKPFSTWCSYSVLSPLTLWCSILQNTFKAFNICCDFGVQMVF